MLAQGKLSALHLRMYIFFRQLDVLSSQKNIMEIMRRSHSFLTVCLCNVCFNCVQSCWIRASKPKHNISFLTRISWLGSMSLKLISIAYELAGELCSDEQRFQAIQICNEKSCDILMLVLSNLWTLQQPDFVSQFSESDLSLCLQSLVPSASSFWDAYSYFSGQAMIYARSIKRNRFIAFIEMRLSQLLVQSSSLEAALDIQERECKRTKESGWRFINLWNIMQLAQTQLKRKDFKNYMNSCLTLLRYGKGVSKNNLLQVRSNLLEAMNLDDCSSMLVSLSRYLFFENFSLFPSAPNDVEKTRIDVYIDSKFLIDFPASNMSLVIRDDNSATFFSLKNIAKEVALAAQEATVISFASTLPAGSYSFHGLTFNFGKNLELVLDLKNSHKSFTVSQSQGKLAVARLGIPESLFVGRCQTLGVSVSVLASQIQDVRLECDTRKDLQLSITSASLGISNPRTETQSSSSSGLEDCKYF